VKFVHNQGEHLKDAGLMDLAREMSIEARVSSDELAVQPGRLLMSGTAASV
jgi:hypothetical protein